MDSAQLAYLIIACFYSALAFCSIVLLAKGICRPDRSSSAFSKTRVILFLVFLCSVLRTSSFAALFDDSVARSTVEARRFLFDFPGLLSFSIFSAYFIEFYGIVFDIVQSNRQSLRSYVFATLAILNMLLYTIECILITSPHLADFLYPSWVPPTGAPTVAPGPTIAPDDSGTGSPAFRVLDLQFAVAFTVLALLFVALTASVFASWRDQAWKDQSLLSRSTLFRNFFPVLTQILFWSLFIGVALVFRASMCIYIVASSDRVDCYDQTCKSADILNLQVPYYLVGECLPIGLALLCQMITACSCQCGQSAKSATASTRLLETHTPTVTTICPTPLHACLTCSASCSSLDRCCVPLCFRAAQSCPTCCADAEQQSYFISKPDPEAGGSSTDVTLQEPSFLFTLAPLRPYLEAVCCCCGLCACGPDVDDATNEAPAISRVPSAASTLTTALGGPAYSSAGITPPLTPMHSGYSPMSTANSSPQMHKFGKVRRSNADPHSFAAVKARDLPSIGIKADVIDALSADNEGIDQHDDLESQYDSPSLSTADSLVCSLDPDALRAQSEEQQRYEQQRQQARPSDDFPLPLSVRQFSAADLRFDARIGVGNFGEVFHAMLHRSTPVAVKRLFIPNSALTPQLLRAFADEVTILSRLSHPNILQFMGVMCPPDLAIVTEYMDMGSLHDVLHGQSPLVLNWTVALQMLRDAARGIAYLHNLQPPVVHRDLKPANLLVNSSLTVKVADFGISRDVANHTMTAIGTAQWMAPEVIRNEAYTVSADTYAFGVIIWEVCCRRLPFGDCNPVQVILKVNAGERPQLPAQLPTVLSNLITKCWAEDPTARPSFSDIAEALAVLAPDATWPPYPQLKSI